MPELTVRVEGLRELEDAFRAYDRNLAKGLREAMEAGAEVVRPEAESLALAEIPRIRVASTTIPWHLMRVGVSRREGGAYVAPVQRGAFTKKNRIFRERYARPKFKEKMLSEALEPALAANTERVRREFEDALADLARAWSRLG